MCWRVFLSKLQAGDTKFDKSQVKTFKGSYLNIVAPKGIALISKFIGATPIVN